MFSSFLTMYTPQESRKRKKSDHAGVEKGQGWKESLSSNDVVLPVYIVVWEMCLFNSILESFMNF